MTEPDDIALLRRAFAVARRARDNGRHPFGCILVDRGGNIVMEQENAYPEEGPTGHAERVLMTRASRAFTAEVLSTHTMYTSAEPCAMCAGATYWAGVGRVVYGLSEARLKDHIGPHPENLTMDLPCRAVFAAGQRKVAVIGPLLEDEALALHVGAWTLPA